MNLKNLNFKKINLKDKNTWLCIGLVGILLLILALPTENESAKEVKQKAGNTASDEKKSLEEAAREEPFLTATEEMEKKLEETLSLIEGAGRVRVMITWKDQGERIVEKDESYSSDAQTDGTTRTDKSQSSVYEQRDNEEIPYVKNELMPQAEGVLVVAQGGGNSMIKQQILQSVMALFPLEAHKITIVKMSMQEVSKDETF
ncbi:MAG: stage III sporulation protein AG [Eubacterium sp.]|nr:stage III sporulation protein AG [Eubacterium sp.]